MHKGYPPGPSCKPDVETVVAHSWGTVQGLFLRIRKRRCGCHCGPWGGQGCGLPLLLGRRLLRSWC